MGMAPLSWREIDAWCNRTRIDLSPWEARLIRRLSSTYLTESRRAEDENCPAPWLGIVTECERDAEDRALRALLR